MEATGSVEGDDLLDALEEAERAQLITTLESGRDIRYRFAHELIRQTLIDNLSLPRRQRLHLRLADAIEAVGGRAAEKQASTLAHHLYQAGAAADAEKTVRFLTLAGEQAIAKAAFEEALQYFDNALSIQEGNESMETAGLREKRGVALRSLGRADDAIAEWRTALSAYEALGDEASVVRVAEFLTMALGWQAKIDDADRVSRRALDRVSAGATGRGRLVAARAMMKSTRSDPDSFGLVDESVRMAEETGDRDLLAFVAGMQTLHRWQWMQCAEGIDSGLRALDLLHAPDASWHRAEMLGPLVYSLLYAGRFGEATERGGELRSLAARLGHQMGAWNEETIAALRHAAWAGDLAAADAQAVAALARAQHANIGWIGPSYRVLALVRFLQGRWNEMPELIDEAVEREVAGSFITGSALGQRFWFDAHLGKRSLDLLDDPRLPLPKPGKPNVLGSWLALAHVTEGLALVGERARAAAFYPLLLEALGTGAKVASSAALWETLAGIAAAWRGTMGCRTAALRDGAGRGA